MTWKKMDLWQTVRGLTMSVEEQIEFLLKWAEALNQKVGGYAKLLAFARKQRDELKTRVRDLVVEAESAREKLVSANSMLETLTWALRKSQDDRDWLGVQAARAGADLGKLRQEYSRLANTWNSFQAGRKLEGGGSDEVREAEVRGKMVLDLARAMVREMLAGTVGERGPVVPPTWYEGK